MILSDSDEQNAMNSMLHLFCIFHYFSSIPFFWLLLSIPFVFNNYIYIFPFVGRLVGVGGSGVGG